MAVSGEVELATLVQQEIYKDKEFRLDQATPVELMIKNLNIWAQIKQGKPCKKQITNKLILNSVTCAFRAGTATAILGSSGSGKTTMLNYISSRMEDSALKSNGDLYINGEKVNSIKPIKHRTGYVTQFDVVFADLTPREQMLYSAKLAGVGNPEAKVNEVLDILGLQGCSNTRVGDDLNRGISGGERKRTAVGIELITDPSLLFLDEPTTGLDSKSALDIAFLLKKLADNGRTVITTIHSPSAEILEQFNRVVCLCKGEIVYDGPPTRINQYFSEIGFAPPPLTNPADHLMAIIHEDDIRIKALKEGTTIEDNQIAGLFAERIELFVSTCKANNVEPFPVHDSPVPIAEVKREKDLKTSVFGNFCLVLSRLLKIYFRNPQQFRTKLIQNTGFAVFALILLHKTVAYTHNTQQAILDRGGMAFQVAATMGFAGIFSNMYTFIPALPIFRRESQNKLYGPVTFYLSHGFFELPVHFLLSNVYLLMIFWAINMRNDSFWVYVQYVITFTLVKLSAGGMGDALALIFKNIAIVNQTFPATVVPLFLLSGFAAKIKSIVIYMIIYSYLSFFRFGFQAILDIEFTNDVRASIIQNCRILKKNCNDKENPLCYNNFAALPAFVQRPPPCNPRTYYDFYETEWYHELLILIAQSIFFRIICIIVVYKFVRESNIVNDDIPSELLPIINSRNQMKYSPLSISYNDKPQKKGQNEERMPLNAVTPTMQGTAHQQYHSIPHHNADDPHRYQKPMMTDEDPTPL
jgi:ABC-type multidrug transport system ATPase subunit